MFTTRLKIALRTFDNPLVLINVLIILGSSSLALFLTFPYRINLYLAWEGAYRMFNGEVPFRDFGMPLGYGFWLIPTAFFHVFGPYVATLLKAQAFINALSLFSFWGILKRLNVSIQVIFLSLLVLILSFTLPNFWPWYNHTTIAYQFVALYFAIAYMTASKLGLWSLLLAALFSFLSFWTKQDGGGLTIIVISCLFAYCGISNGSWKSLFIYLVLVGVFTALFIIPVLGSDFTYWFNYGQFPHFSRVTFFDLMDALLGESFWEKFYLIVILLIILSKYRASELLKFNRSNLLLLMTLGVIIEALIFQVTSYIPRESNIFFHAFAVAFILSFFEKYVNFKKPILLLLTALAISAWWSGDFWNKSLKHKFKGLLVNSADEQHVISRNTFIVNNDSTSTDRSSWRLSELKTFKDVSLPDETIKGIARLQNLIADQGFKKPYTLNMSELTPLNHEFNFLVDRGTEYPLWYHKGVCLFDREIAMYCDKVDKLDYDLILFETIPQLNEFYPTEVKSCIIENYKLVDKFLAPRIPNNSFVEVYMRID